MLDLKLKFKMRKEENEQVKDANGTLIPYNVYSFETVNLNTGEVEEYDLKARDMVSKKLLKDYYVNNNEPLVLCGEKRKYVNKDTKEEQTYYLFGVEIFDKNSNSKVWAYLDVKGNNDYAEYCLINAYNRALTNDTIPF